LGFLHGLLPHPHRHTSYPPPKLIRRITCTAYLSPLHIHAPATHQKLLHIATQWCGDTALNCQIVISSRMVAGNVLHSRVSTVLLIASRGFCFLVAGCVQDCPEWAWLGVVACGLICGYLRALRLSQGFGCCVLGREQGASVAGIDWG
jgi:hypothetical protein